MPWRRVTLYYGGILVISAYNPHYLEDLPTPVSVVKTQPIPTGLGGAPTRPRIMPRDSTQRKKVPLASGLFDYFPDALIAVAIVSQLGNDQHNPGKPLHWSRDKSNDEALIRDPFMDAFLGQGFAL